MSTNQVEVLKDEAFDKINHLLMDLDKKTGQNIESTNHIFDLMEEVMARLISGSAMDEANLVEIQKESSSRILNMARLFYNEEKKS